MAGVTVPARGRLMTMGGGAWGWEGPEGGAGGEAGGGRVETRELPSKGAEGGFVVSTGYDAVQNSANSAN